MKRLADFLRRHWHKLIQLHDTPHKIAGGTAIGFFFGFTPFFGLKTWLGMGAACGFRCSCVAAAIGVTLHDLFFLLWPVILRVEYGIGYWLLHSPHHWPEKIKIHQFSISHWLQWKTLTHVIWPTFIGSLVIGIPISVAVFFLMLRIVEGYQAKRRVADAAALGLEMDDFT